MIKENTRYLRDLILANKVSSEEEINNIICSFSEYMVASNPEYLYNKTYLEAFVDEFIECNKALKLKYDIIVNQIQKVILGSGIEMGKWKIDVDNAWLCDGNLIKLLNSFDKNQICSGKIRYDIEYLGEKGFAVANEISLDVDYKDILKADVLLFIKKYEEVKKNDQQDDTDAKSNE